MAVSGGCDSLALLVLLCRTTDRNKLTAVYVNHRIRSVRELEREVELNRENCRKLGVAFETEDLGERTVYDLAAVRKKGLEEAARVLRYSALRKYASEHGVRYILTAHHYDDQLETLQMRFRRGSPVTSMVGIREKLETDDGIFIVRPLLDFRKKELEDYLEKAGFEYSTDSTNADNLIERNRVRNVELPELKASDRLWEQKLMKLHNEALALCGDFVFHGTDCVDIDYYKALTQAQQLTVLFSMWRYVMGTLLPYTLTERLDEAVRTYSGSCIQVGANKAVFSLCNGKIFLTSDADEELFRNSVEITPGRRGTVELSGFRLIIGGEGTQKSLRMSSRMFSGRVVLRFPEEGDAVVLSGGTKKLTRVFQDMKIPPALRKRVPVIADDRGICAVFGSVYGAGDRLAARFRTDGFSVSGGEVAGEVCTCLKE